MTDKELTYRIAGLETARAEAVALRGLASIRQTPEDREQRRMASRIIDRIDERIAELRERQDCHSEDLIDEGLRA